MDTIDKAAITKFKLDYNHAVQQVNSKLEGTVMVDQHEGKRKRYTIQDELSYSARSGRLQDTTNTEAQYNFRWLNTTPYDLSPTWDRDDEFLLAEMTNPRSPLMMGMTYAYKRLCDDIKIAALSASAVEGEDGTVTTAFPASQDVPVDYVETGTAANSNFTLGKMRRILEVFNENDVDPGLEKFCLIGPSQLKSLQRIPEYQNLDTNSKRALVTGEPTPFLGLTFILSTRLSDAANVRTCFAYTKPTLIFNPGPLDIDFSERTDKRHDRQIYSYARLGAMRLYDKQVVRFFADETT